MGRERLDALLETLGTFKQGQVVGFGSPLREPRFELRDAPLEPRQGQSQVIWNARGSRCRLASLPRAATHRGLPKEERRSNSLTDERDEGGHQHHRRHLGPMLCPPSHGDHHDLLLLELPHPPRATPPATREFAHTIGFVSDGEPFSRPPDHNDRRLRAGRHPLAAELAVSLRDHGALEGGRILLAVSGGPDSLALLWLAAAIADRVGSGGEPWEPIVAHVDHGLREESAEEARYVEAQARAAGLPVESIKVDCRGSGNVSDRARRARYEALEGAARRRGCHAIVTAHHAEDRLESILIGLGRGRGLEALRAMPATRSLGDGLVLVRPLLGVSKEALEACCRSLDLSPIRDPSNADPRRLRARLREVVMPELEAILPGASMHAGAIVNEAELASIAIDRWLDETFGPASLATWSRTSLAGLATPLRIAGLHRAMRELDPTSTRAVPRRSVEAVAQAIGDREERPRRWLLGASLEAEITRQTVLVRRREPLPQGEADSHGPRHAAT